MTDAKINRISEIYEELAVGSPIKMPPTAEVAALLELAKEENRRLRESGSTLFLDLLPYPSAIIRSPCLRRLPAHCDLPEFTSELDMTDEVAVNTVEQLWNFDCKCEFEAKTKARQPALRLVKETP